MWCRCLLLTVAAASAAYGAGPVYSADSITSGANFVSGPLAPNSLATVFGKDLAWRAEGLSSENTAAGYLPNSLAGARVYIANYPAPLIYVCPTQINFLIPGNLRPGPVPFRVVRQGVTGPEVTVTLVAAAPQLFQTADGYAIAQHADYSLVRPESPAAPGEVIVVYATGLGITAPNPNPGEIPIYPGIMRALDQLTVSIGTSRRRIQPPSCSVPASSIVATYAFARSRPPIGRPYHRRPCPSSRRIRSTSTR